MKKFGVNVTFYLFATYLIENELIINKTMKTFRHISAIILSTSSRNGISIFCSDFTGRNNGIDTGYGFR